jgi:type III secretion system FlhB-like substrate exporter
VNPFAEGGGIRKDAQQLEEMLEQEHSGSRIPSEVYDLMAVVINFAQELNEEWARAHPGRT